jgi:hypothetical protein
VKSFGLDSEMSPHRRTRCDAELAHELPQGLHTALDLGVPGIGAAEPDEIMIASVG